MKQFMSLSFLWKKVIQKRYSYSNQCNLSISEFPISEKLVIPPIILKDDDFFSETEVFKNNSGSSNQFNNQSKNLLLRTSSEELSKKFGVNEVGWSDTGLTLIRCDKLSSMKSNQEKSNDRLSVYNIFYILSTGNSYSGTFEQCPKRWNNNIWQLTYDILTSNKAFDPLIAMIMKELEQNALSLRCKIARVACQD